MKVFFAALTAALVASGCTNGSKPEAAVATPAASTATVQPTSVATNMPKDSGTAPVAFKCEPAAKAGEFYTLGAKDITDDETSMCQYRGKVVLVVNVASKCGNTPQYIPLEKLYATNKANGLVVLGFPCNQFGSQESGTNEDIKGFCESTYGVDFPMFAKIDVNGATAHPVYKWLKSQPGGEGEIDWNFAKFLIGRNGKLIKRFANSVQPDAKEITDAVAAALVAL
jgi:glutathione peroxidase